VLCFFFSSAAAVNCWNLDLTSVLLCEGVVLNIAFYVCICCSGALIVFTMNLVTRMVVAYFFCSSSAGRL